MRRLCIESLARHRKSTSAKSLAVASSRTLPTTASYRMEGFACLATRRATWTLERTKHVSIRLKAFGNHEVRRAAGLVPAGINPAARSFLTSALRGCSKCVHMFSMTWRCHHLARPGFQPFARWQIRRSATLGTPSKELAAPLR
jgi:hypothetical protein